MSASVNQRLGRSQRLRASTAIQRLVATRRRVSDPLITLYHQPANTAVTRFAVSINRKHGGAVRRNRVKRLLREAFRRNRAILPAPLDLLAVWRGDAAAAGYAEVEASMQGLLKRLLPVYIPGKAGA